LARHGLVDGADVKLRVNSWWLTRGAIAISIRHRAASRDIAGSRQRSRLTPPVRTVAHFILFFRR
jgi:hypothetical protein